jgi:hypothetical protein
VLLAVRPDTQRRDYLTRMQADGRTRLDRLLGGELDRVTAQICDETAACYRPRYLNIQRLNYLWTIRHSSARIAGNLIT